MLSGLAVAWRYGGVDVSTCEEGLQRRLSTREVEFALDDQSEFNLRVVKQN